MTNERVAHRKSRVHFLSVSTAGRILRHRPATRTEDVVLKTTICEWLNRQDTFSERQQALAAAVRRWWPGFSQI
jgi:hypothetical protein